MTYNDRLQAAYNAACHALSGRYNGNMHDTAERIARNLADRDDHPDLTRSYNARHPLVEQITAADVAAGVRGGAAHVRPLIDNAVALAARAVVAAADDLSAGRCDCRCHRPGVHMRHMVACCKPSQTADSRG